MTPRVRLTNEQREELLALYLTDRRAAYRLARQYGVRRTYLPQLAERRGVKCRLPFNNRGVPKYSEDGNDPRWEWAKARGMVIV